MSTHSPDHALGMNHAFAEGWFYCQDCHYVVCGGCRKATCTCSALAEAATNEVASPKPQEEAPKRASRPKEGRMATATKTDEPKVDKRTDASERRGRGELEKLVKDVTDAYSDGKVTLPEGKLLTPQRIASIIGEKNGEDKPSSGAVASILKRWDEAGYALTHAKPYAFKAVSARGKKFGLEDLKAKLKAKKKAERDAEREEAKAAKAASKD